MPWKEVSIMDQRNEFVRLALQEGANRRELCRRFGIHPSVGYKWIGRWLSGEELADRSRRPHSSSGRTAPAIEERILSLRDAHPAWGARKIAHCLKRDGIKAPAVSVVHEILRRNGKIVAPVRGSAGHLRFEKPAPNLLWQMDFKGAIQLVNGERCHPLTIVDDHSRYSIGLEACGDEQSLTVQGRLQHTFHRYGLPDAFFLDNGSPWGDPAGERWTSFGVWLLKLGVAVLHSRPIIRRAAVRMSASIAHSTSRCLRSGVSAISLKCSAHSMFGARFTISNDRTRRSAWPCPQAAIGPASAPCRTTYRLSNTTKARSCAASPAPRPMSASKVASGKCPGRSAANG